MEIRNSYSFKEHIDKNVKPKLNNLVLVFLVFGWYILINILNICGIEFNLYKYVYITSPLFFVMLVKTKSSNEIRGGIIYVYMMIFLYLLVKAAIHNNLTDPYPVPYYITMLYSFFFIQPLLIINIDRFNINYYKKYLYYIIFILNILAMLELGKTNFYISNRFLNIQATSFLVAQFIIIVLHKQKKHFLDFIGVLLSIFVMLATGARASFLSVVLVCAFELFKNYKKTKYVIVCLICTYFFLYYYYYNHLIYLSNFSIFIRPLGLIFFDKNIVFDRSNIGRLIFFNEYSEKIINGGIRSFLFGLSPKSFSFYSHNIFFDIIGFGGIMLLLIFAYLFYLVFKERRNSKLIFSQILFFFICSLFTGSIFINITFFSLITILFNYKEEQEVVK